MLCLGTNSDILPNKKLWTQSQVGMESQRVNILAVTLKTMCTVLEYVKLLSASDFTEAQCKTIQQVGHVATLHALNLFQLKQVLLEELMMYLFFCYACRSYCVV